MKKKLEAELISIAHRILKLKNKSELDQLLIETQKLYEKLSVLKFVEENFADVKPTIGRSEAEEILATAFDEPEPAAEIKEETAAEVPVAQTGPKASTTEEKPEEAAQPEEKAEEHLPNEKALETPEEKETDELVAEAEESPEEEPSVPEAGIDFEEPETKQEIAAVKEEEKPADDLFKPAFEWTFDNKTEDKQPEAETPKAESGQVAFEDLLGAGYKDPVFVKPGETGELPETDLPAEDNFIEPVRAEQPKADVIPITRKDDKVPVFKMNSDTVSLNDRISKGITVGLNDRIAFVKNLFNNSNEDYNRVLSQLITFDTLAEAQDFIDNIVKPDYNNWDGKEEYAQRFMEVVEKKFS